MEEKLIEIFDGFGVELDRIEHSFGDQAANLAEVDIFDGLRVTAVPVGHRDTGFPVSNRRTVSGILVETTDYGSGYTPDFFACADGVEYGLSGPIPDGFTDRDDLLAAVIDALACEPPADT